jgi:hypothetical protein
MLPIMSPCRAAAWHRFRLDGLGSPPALGPFFEFIAQICGRTRSKGGAGSWHQAIRAPANRSRSTCNPADRYEAGRSSGTDGGANAGLMPG